VSDRGHLASRSDSYQKENGSKATSKFFTSNFDCYCNDESIG
ncbi:MAG: hypothetical protein ACI97P_001151, partial [Arcticibacterium sp.]